MKNNFKKLGVALLTLVLITGALPLTAAAADYSRYVGTWTYSELVTSSGSSDYDWYAKLTIHSISGNRVTFDLGGGREFRGTGSPRYASISNVTTDAISSNQANFRYKDNWDNSGRGTITFREDGVTVSLTEEKGSPTARYALTLIPHDVLMQMKGFVPGPITPDKEPEGQTPFNDVYEDDWYVEAVRYAYAQGLFNGTSNTTFSPNTTMTRVQITQVLANRTEGYSPSDYAGATIFSDVKADHWGNASITWAYRNGLISGGGDNDFNPEDDLTREQLAIVLYNYARRTGADTTLSGSRYSQFTDTATVHSWAVEAMQWAVNKGIINGSGGLLNASSSVTRAEVAQMFLNARDVLTSTTLVDE